MKAIACSLICMESFKPFEKTFKCGRLALGVSSGFALEKLVDQFESIWVDGIFWIIEQGNEEAGTS